MIFGRNNPLRVRHISYRVEFQGRGAGHIHGVLWLDINQIEIAGVASETLASSFEKLRYSSALEEEEVKALERFTDTFVTCTRCVTVAGEDAVRKAEEVNWHGHSSSCHKDGPRHQCRWKFPKYPLARTIFVDANRKVLEEEYKMPKENRDQILDRVMKVLIETEGNKMLLSRDVEKIMTSFPNVKVVQQGEESLKKSSDDEETFKKSHGVEESLKETHGSEESFKETHGSEESLKETHGGEESFNKAPQDVREKGRRDRFKKRIGRVTYVKMESPQEYGRNIKKRIEMVLKLASAGGDPISYYQYEMAVKQQPRKGSEVLLRRDIDEVFMSNYNPEWMEAWDANHDISPVYDYFGVITYVTDYFTKVSISVNLIFSPVPAFNLLKSEILS